VNLKCLNCYELCCNASKLNEVVINQNTNNRGSPTPEVVKTGLISTQLSPFHQVRPNVTLAQGNACKKIRQSLVGSCLDCDYIAVRSHMLKITQQTSVGHLHCSWLKDFQNWLRRVDLFVKI
jgi:hypothetical protein